MMSERFSFQGSSPRTSCKDLISQAVLVLFLSLGNLEPRGPDIPLFPGVIPCPPLWGCVRALLCEITNRAVSPLVPGT